MSDRIREPRVLWRPLVRDIIEQTLNGERERRDIAVIAPGWEVCRWLHVRAAARWSLPYFDASVSDMLARRRPASSSMATSGTVPSGAIRTTARTTPHASTSSKRFAWRTGTLACRSSNYKPESGWRAAVTRRCHRPKAIGGSMRPILLACCSVNHMAPSGPAAM